jgi:hypothetical protein
MIFGSPKGRETCSSSCSLIGRAGVPICSGEHNLWILMPTERCEQRAERHMYASEDDVISEGSRLSKPQPSRVLALNFGHVVHESFLLNRLRCCYLAYPSFRDRTLRGSTLKS